MRRATKIQLTIAVVGSFVFVESVVFPILIKIYRDGALQGKTFWVSIHQQEAMYWVIFSAIFFLGLRLVTLFGRWVWKDKE